MTDPAPGRSSRSDLGAILRASDDRRIALIRGAIALATGLMALVQPSLAEVAIGVALILISLLELGIRRRGSASAPAATRFRGVRILVGLATGIVLVLGSVTGGVVAEHVVASAAALLGVVDLIAAVRGPTRAGRDLRLARGLLFIALTVVLVVIPAVAWGAILLVGSATMIGVGSLLIATAIRAPVPVSSRDEAEISVGIVGLLGAWMRQRDIGTERRAEILDAYAYDAPVADKLTRFTILLGLSATIAAVGLIADSVAVIIGAMIIAPLMSPILGISLGIVTGLPERALRSLLVTAFGIALTIGVAVVAGSWLATPAVVFTPEVASRTSPTILDLVIALAAGVAGAYGASNRKVADSLAGVAISISLVPPLATVGLLLGQGDFPGASGALLLFMTNFVSIVLAATVVFVLFGVAPLAELMADGSRTRAWLLTFAAGALVLTIPLALAFQSTYQQSTDELAATQTLQAWLPTDDSYQILGVVVRGNDVSIELAGPPEAPDTATLDEQMDVALGRDVSTQVRIFVAVTYPSAPPP